MNNKIHVVQTLVDGLDSDGNSDTMPGQIIGCFDDKDLAERVKEKVRKKKPIEGLDYTNIPDYVDVKVLTFPLNGIIRA